MKRTITTVVLLVSVLAVAAMPFVIGAEGEVKQELPAEVSTAVENGEKQEPLTEVPEDMSMDLNEVELINNPRPIFEANDESLCLEDARAKPNDPERTEQVESIGGEILYEAIITYGEYVDRFANGDRLTAFDDNRLVLVVQTFYPEFDHNRVGVFRNCIATGLWDAETGEYIGGRYVGEIIEQRNDPFGD